MRWREARAQSETGVRVLLFIYQGAAHDPADRSRYFLRAPSMPSTAPPAPPIVETTLRGGVSPAYGVIPSNESITAASIPAVRRPLRLRPAAS